VGDRWHDRQGILAEHGAASDGQDAGQGQRGEAAVRPARPMLHDARTVAPCGVRVTQRLESFT
jgi:hypothetical protein